LSAEGKKSLETQVKIHRLAFERDLKAAWDVLLGKEAARLTRYLERPPVD